MLDSFTILLYLVYWSLNCFPRFKANIDWYISNVAKSNFLTDKFSTTGGLAAVAYGSSSLFSTVADQIKRGSKTRGLDSQLPSHAFLDFVGTKRYVYDIFKAVVQEEYDAEEIITDFIDLYATNVDVFTEVLTDNFIKSINNYSTYSVSPSTIILDSIEKTLSGFTDSVDLEVDAQDLSTKIQGKFVETGYIGEDVASVMVFLINNPNTKVSAAPPDNIVQLDVRGLSTKDARGVDRNYGTIPPQNYYSGTAYRNEGSSFKKAVVQGYVGYPLVSLLGESILNPDSYENLDLNYTGSSILNNLEDNSYLSDKERAIYNLSLATLNLGND